MVQIFWPTLYISSCIVVALRQICDCGVDWDWDGLRQRPWHDCWGEPYTYDHTL